MKKNIFLVINFIFPLLVGAAIYCFTSQDVIFVEAVSSLWGTPVNAAHVFTDGGLFRFVRYYIPDMLWAYALVFALYFTIGNMAARIKMAFLIAVFFSTVMEIIQLYPLFPGTFDILDILVEIVSEMIAALIIKILYEEACNIWETK